MIRGDYTRLGYIFYFISYISIHTIMYRKYDLLSLIFFHKIELTYLVLSVFQKQLSFLKNISENNHLVSAICDVYLILK